MNHEEEGKLQSDEVTETQGSEVAETQSSEIAVTERSEVTHIGAGGAVENEELFNRLKGELMEEIRKYFEPLVKEAGKVAVPPVPPAPAEKVEELPDEDDLIVKLLEETGWRNG